MYFASENSILLVIRLQLENGNEIILKSSYLINLVLLSLNSVLNYRVYTVQL